MTKLPLILLLAGAGLLQGCSAFDKHHGVNWGEGTCPTPAPEAISKSKQLIIEDGKPSNARFVLMSAIWPVRGSPIKLMPMASFARTD